MFNQLEFLDKNEEEKMREEILILHKKYENQRKSYYANDNKRKKEIDDLRHKLETLIIAVCKNEEYKSCFIR
jgi:hypothetical protein